MALLPNYEYDVFISYRHKDNKYDGWVTDFVANLRREIGATFKEDISVYFDSNSYDGLLETHSVDKSLEAKLKSLVFMPIISQTYCDTKSFAWQHEFCVFNKLAKEDPLGRDIRLSNGNVASRILPIKIHDLDAEDQAILEKELGGALRAVEFIFKSAGVNRPLHASDKREENFNRLFYRDQINKVANAIKEVTNGMRNPGKRDVVVSKKPALEAIAEKAESLNKSIAVLPFTNLSQDVAQEYFADGITENILNQLALNSTLRVISRTSIARYKNSGKAVPEIARELGAKFVIEGSAQIHKEKVRISVQLIDPGTDARLWTKVFNESLDDLFEVQDRVAEAVANELNASESKQKKAEVVPTKNYEAYDLFLKGRHAYNQWSVEGYRTATEYFKKAVALDANFREAYSYLASSYSARMSWNGDLSPSEAKTYIDEFLTKAWQGGPTDNDYLTKAFVEFFINKDFVAAERNLIRATELNPNNALAIYSYCYLLNMASRFQEAAQWLNKGKAIEPWSMGYFNQLVIGYYVTGQFDLALSTLSEAQQMYPASQRLFDYWGRILLMMGKPNEAAEKLEMGLLLNAVRPPSMVANLAVALHQVGEEKKSKNLVDELLVRSNANEKGVNIYLVYAYAGLGNLKLAQDWLARARTTNDVDLIWIQVDPLLKHLSEKTTGDFQDAEKKINDWLEREMPQLPYHNIVHIRDVAQAAQRIAEQESVSPEEKKLMQLAALLHDIGFVHGAKGHEARGAEMVRELLPQFGFDTIQIETIANMILATKLPQSPQTQLEKILCDADLDYLGRDDFFEISNKLFQEMKDAGVVENEREWNLVQRTFLQGHRYHTGYSKAIRESGKQQRLNEIVEQLKKKS
ncbi:MAG: HD domain-containing protein [Cytophagales bacterium]|jgi:TolB-like protein/predicted metal-dependent HD superfamily phosphohydrolase/Tfp pilus assembly protein PilF|nr:HD domain-containing protein [Cytophagales bacterium]